MGRVWPHSSQGVVVALILKQELKPFSSLAKNKEAHCCFCKAKCERTDLVPMRKCALLSGGPNLGAGSCKHTHAQGCTVLIVWTTEEDRRRAASSRDRSSRPRSLAIQEGTTRGKLPAVRFYRKGTFFTLLFESNERSR